MRKSMLLGSGIGLSVLLLTSCANRGADLRAQPVMFMATPSTGPQRSITVTLPPIEDFPVTLPVTAAITRSTTESLAGTSPSVREQPSRSGSGSASEKPPASSLEIKCVRSWNFLKGQARDSGETGPQDQCLYMSVDMHKLFEQPVRNRAERNRLVFLLMNVSDANCSTYIHRFYASKASLDAARNTGKDIATAIAAGTAKVASGFSSAIGLANLAGGTAIDNVDKSFFSEKALQAITAAISSLRATSKKRLLDASGKLLTEYSYFEALNDLEEFDQDCSLQRGVEQLAELANHASITAEAQLNSTRAANVEELKKDLEAARRERDDAVKLRAEVQQQLSRAKDEAERASLQKQIETLTAQVQKANDEVTKLRQALPTGTPAPTPPSKPDDVAPKPTVTPEPIPPAP